MDVDGEYGMHSSFAASRQNIIDQILNDRAGATTTGIDELREPKTMLDVKHGDSQNMDILTEYAKLEEDRTSRNIDIRSGRELSHKTSMDQCGNMSNRSQDQKVNQTHEVSINQSQKDKSIDVPDKQLF